MKKWEKENLEQELDRIQRFIRDYADEGETVVVAVSGGLDSDVTARLCCRAVGNRRLKLFMVIEDQMEEKFLLNARRLADDLKVSLKEIHLERWNKKLIQALEDAEGKQMFCADTLLDPGKAKCSVRSSVLSCYQDKGCVIAGTTNRTEKELGFFLTFGDNLAHLRPIAHLYKSELPDFAAALGTAREVIEQESSAGFWEGQTDREDLAYWILNDGPIVFSRKFTDEETAEADRIKKELLPEKVDQVLLLYQGGETGEKIADQTSLSIQIVQGLIHIVNKSRKLKNRKIMVEIDG